MKIMLIELSPARSLSASATEPSWDLHSEAGVKRGHITRVSKTIWYEAETTTTSE